ncbi:dehydration-responsive element-binding protein 1A-like protein [Carex littledalei]|uniref:Dehydration-responsive element-binding protein 1A-like protein n=1 Tax=Carex littledalei TaxID=544730 RepID=A0A833VG96_9POAL|nr:dehydration-responsive element-binding protein 1A-like protein [Carex littledalei]
MESSSSSDTDYTTVWSAPPKKPSGRTKFKETRHPVYRGVRRRGTTNRWVCEVRNPNNKSRIWLELKQAAIEAAKALHSSNSSDLAKNISSSASSTTDTVDEKEVVSSSLSVSKSNLVSNDHMDLNWDGNGDTNLKLYYASLAEGLMLEPPFDLFGDLDDNQWCTMVSLWS